MGCAAPPGEARPPGSSCSDWRVKRVDPRKNNGPQGFRVPQRAAYGCARAESSRPAWLSPLESTRRETARPIYVTLRRERVSRRFWPLSLCPDLWPVRQAPFPGVPPVQAYKPLARSSSGRHRSRMRTASSISGFGTREIRQERDPRIGGCSSRLGPTHFEEIWGAVSPERPQAPSDQAILTAPRNAIRAQTNRTANAASKKAKGIHMAGRPPADQ